MPRRRSLKVCVEPGCPILTDSAKCPEHTAEYRKTQDAARPSSSARGYDRTHNQERARLTPIVETGTVRCARCNELILPGQPWDLGHDDNDRSRYSGPEHRACNRATKSHRAKRGKP